MAALPLPCDLPMVWPPAVRATVSSSSMPMRAKVSRICAAVASGSDLPFTPSGLT
ncbi:hypothetical protein D3C78_1207730 [compost metagenome]